MHNSINPEGDDALNATIRNRIARESATTRFNVRHRGYVDERWKNDWMEAFFFGFGPSKLSTDFYHIVSLIETMYLDSSIETVKAAFGMPSGVEKKLIVDYISHLKRLCEQNDETDASEEAYIPIKYFMLILISLNAEIFNLVLKKIPLQNCEKVQRLFGHFVGVEFSKLIKSPFNEINSHEFVKEFYRKCLEEYKFGWTKIKNDVV